MAFSCTILKTASLKQANKPGRAKLRKLKSNMRDKLEFLRRALMKQARGQAGGRLK